MTERPERYDPETQTDEEKREEAYDPARFGERRKAQQPFIAERRRQQGSR